MQIRARMSMSADGYVTTPSGWPAGDVHLVGGPRTIETFRALGALDKLELVVLPLLFGAGMRLTPSLSPDAGLTFERERALLGGSVEIVYAPTAQAKESPARDAAWSPASQR
jgi:dihydrofolate reductase